MIDSFTEMRRRNALRVLELIREHRELSRADVARLTGLSKATVSSITADLLEASLVHETGALIADKGRKPTGLVFNARAKVAVGVAFDGEGVTLVFTDLDGRLLHSSGLVRIHDGQEYGAVVRAVSTLLETAGLPESSVCSIGVAKPGPLPVSAEDVSFELCGKLRARYGVQVPMQTLVDMAAVAEAHASQLPEDRLVLFIRTSHQLRSAMLMGRRLLFVHGQVGGDPGHIAAPWIKEQCSCGNTGCVNAHVGFDAFVTRMRERGCQLASGQPVTKIIAEREDCRDIVQDAGKAVGYTIGCLMNILAPITVIVAGFATELGEDFWQSLEDACATYATPANFAVCEMRKSVLGTEAAALGAALFGLESNPLF